MIRDLIVEPDRNRFIEIRNNFATQTVVAKLLGLKDSSSISDFERGECGMDKRTYTLFLLLTSKHPIYKLVNKIQRFSYLELDLLAIRFESKERFKQLREKAKLQQDTIARKLELTNFTLISWYETGEQRPSTQTWTLYLLLLNKHPTFSLKYLPLFDNQ